MDLNAAQAQAAIFKNGPCLVLAGPGSGKTSVITKRLLYLIEKHGVNPFHLLTITFTKAAALEMQSRFYKLSDSQYPEVVFGTFHSVFFQILKQIRKTEVPVFMKPLETYRLTEQILKETGLKYSIESVRGLMNAISASQNGMKAEAPRLSGTYADKFWELEKRFHHLRRNLNLVGFDDIIPDCFVLFQNDSAALEHWRERFRYIQIDEFQDVNSVQLEILKLLAGPTANLFAVGDDDQAIYAFRGATPSSMLDFEKIFQGSTLIRLNINYRSEPDIVYAAEKVISLNEKRLSKESIPFRNESDHSSNTVKINYFDTEEAETEFLLEALSLFINKNKRLNEQEGQTVAVLTRTNYQTTKLALLLSQMKIPYYMKEKVTAFADLPQVMDISAYLRAGSGEVRREDFLRIMNKPLRFIARDAASNPVVNRQMIGKYYARTPYMLKKTDKLFRDFELIGRLSPSKAIDFIRKGIGYDRYCQTEMNSDEYIRIIEILNLLQEQAKSYSDSREFLSSLEEEKKKILELNNNCTKITGKNEQIRLMTLHASKGLEFNTVYIPFLNEGQLPGRQAVTNAAREEERRLLYVGMTRARDSLIMTCVKNEQKRCSSFLMPLINKHTKKKYERICFYLDRFARM